jgi:hypothetical protein
VERGNAYPTPASLYRLCDADAVFDAFKDDELVQAFAAQELATDADHDLLRRMAGTLGVPGDFSSLEAAAKSAGRLISEYGLRSSEYVLTRTREFVESAGKRLLVLLSYSSQDVIDAIRGVARFDKRFLDFLCGNGFDYVDTLVKHVDDYKDFRCTPEEYVARYYIGHYSPHGNHFFAYAIKDEIVAWLDPPPPTYREEGPPLQRLAGTLA